MSEEKDPASSGGFHWDKRIPVALIATLVVQTVLVGMWIGRLEQRVQSLEDSRTESREAPSRIVRLETQIDDVKRTLDKLDIKIDRLIQRPQ